MTVAARPAAHAYASFVRTFGNVLFAVSLFAVWGVLTLIGVIVDQNKEAGAYFAAYPAPIARAILRLRFDNIYHSTWYVGIIGLILLSLAVCTFKRVIPARMPRLHPVKVDQIPLHAGFDMAVTAEAARERLSTLLRARGWHVRGRTFGGVEWTFADRYNWARRGVLIAHLGFVIVAIGTTIYWARGFSGETAVLSGQAVTIPQTRAVLRLDSFAYKIAPIATKSGIVYQPIDYVSQVTISGRDGIATRKIVRVNHPIDVDGTLYYQASYGFGMQFAVMHDGHLVAPLSGRTLFEGDALEIPGTQRSLSYDRFVPTFDRQSGLPSADPRVTNPAAIVSVVENGGSVGSVLVPMKTWLDLGNGWRIVPQRYVVYSGFQYRYDPGIVLVGIGALVLLAGLIVSFYFLPARLYVRVDETGPRRCRVGLAATTVKGYDVFENEFARLVLALHKSPGDRESAAGPDWELASER